MRIDGYIQRVFWKSTQAEQIPGYKYIGFTFLESGKSKEVTCFGTMPRCEKGDEFYLEGEYAPGRNGDTIFKVSGAIKNDEGENGAEQLLKQLFGPKTSILIKQNFFGKAIYAINELKNNEERFKEKCLTVKGVGEKKLNKAIEKFHSTRMLDVLLMEYSQYGMTMNKAVRIFQHFETKSADVIKNNPYDLIQVPGITFKFADNIAMLHFKINPMDMRRVKAVILQIMYENENKGHCFTRFRGNPYNETTEESIQACAQKWIGADEKETMFMLEKLVDENMVIKEIRNEKPVYYLRETFAKEERVAKNLQRLNKKSEEIDEKEVDSLITIFEERNAIQLAKKQKKAIKLACVNNLAIITGLPGTGKTTIIKAILFVLKNINLKQKKEFSATLCAPTGKASSRMTEATNYKAQTIHSLVYSLKGNAKVDTNILIVDEFSMVDLTVGDMLFNKIGKNTKVLLVGDTDQLPSVGNGKLLDDFIKSKELPFVELNEIYRQKQGSTLLSMTKDVHDGKTPDTTTSNDFEMIVKTEVFDIKDSVIQKYLESIKKYGIESTILLIPQNTGPLGCDEMNKTLQEIINPADSSELEMSNGFQKFRKGDRVMQIRNEKKHGVYNGMVGTVVEIEYDKEDETTCMLVDFDGIESVYKSERLEFLKLAYAATVHKSQGSEYPSVIMMITKQHRFMLRKKLFYTGMTRAKKHLTIIGQVDMIETAIKNKLEPYRNTRLAERIKGDI